MLSNIISTKPLYIISHKDITWIRRNASRRVIHTRLDPLIEMSVLLSTSHKRADTTVVGVLLLNLNRGCCQGIYFAASLKCPARDIECYSLNLRCLGVSTSNYHTKHNFYIAIFFKHRKCSANRKRDRAHGCMLGMQRSVVWAPILAWQTHAHRCWIKKRNLAGARYKLCV